MTLKLKKPNNTNSGILSREDKDFDQIIKIPNDSDLDAIQNFFNLTDIHYDKTEIQNALDLLNGNGKCSFSINYYVDMEMAVRANVRSVRFQIYNYNPGDTTTTTIDSGFGNQYYNERYLAMMNSTSTSSGGIGHGRLASSSRNNMLGRSSSVEIASAASSGRNPKSPIKTVTVNTGVTDQIVTDFRREQTQASSNVASSANLKAAVASKALKGVSQVYSAAVTSKVNINAADVASNAKSINRQTNLIDSKIKSNSNVVFEESNQSLMKKSLFYSVTDPTKHVNSFYAAGPTAVSVSGKAGIKYTDSPGNTQNEVDVNRSGVTSGENLSSVVGNNNQNTVSQRGSDFVGNPYQQQLFLKSASVSLPASTNSLQPEITVKEITFRSLLRQFRADLDINFSLLKPSTTENLFVKISLLDRNGEVFKEKISRINLRSQLSASLTPRIPPSIKVTANQVGRVGLELIQTDPLATDISVYRMVASPDRLDDARWTHVTTQRVDVKSGPITYIDTTLQGNVFPKVVLYDARCTGIFGAVCSATSTIVEAGVKQTVAMSPKEKVGECNLVATQNGPVINITISNLPQGVTRVFLKKQLIGNIRSDRNFRNHSFVPVQGKPELLFHNNEGNQANYVFEDVDVINRQVYRYYAQFDWLDKGRTNSISDDYVEYRIIPERPIVSYMENLTISKDTQGIPFVSFDLGANFANEGLEVLNKLLGETGVSSIFVEELRKDRSLISNLLVFSVTRKNLKTDEIVTWPLVNQGKFIDNVESRGSAAAGSSRATSLGLESGGEYLYTARLLMANPESFFRQAFTRIPAATQQIINNSDPNFITVSSRKFSENFAIQPGSLFSPTTLAKDTSFSAELKAAFTGISYNKTVSVPSFNAVPVNVKASRSLSGVPANVISWEVEGSIERVFKFQIDVSVGRENTFPLTSITPNISSNRTFSVRDEIFVNEIAPVSYRVSAIYVDMSVSGFTNSNEIHGGSSLPVKILDSALKLQTRNVPSTNIIEKNPYTFESISADVISQDPLNSGGKVDRGFIPPGR